MHYRRNLILLLVSLVIMSICITTKAENVELKTGEYTCSINEPFPLEAKVTYTYYNDSSGQEVKHGKETWLCNNNAFSPKDFVVKELNYAHGKLALLQ